MSAPAKATHPGGSVLGSGCGTKWRKQSSQNVKNTSPSRTRAAVVAWRAMARVARGASTVETARTVAVVSMGHFSFGFWAVVSAFNLASNNPGPDRHRDAL